MKKLVLTTMFCVMAAGVSFAQGYWIFDNSSDYSGSQNANSIYIGSSGAAGEGTVGQSLGSGSAPNYDISYLYLAGTTYSGDVLTPLQFIADGASFATNMNNNVAQTSVPFAAATGDDADGAGFFEGGSSWIASASDTSLYTIELIAWYDPTGTTSFSQALADLYNVGGSTLDTIEMVAGTDPASEDASGFSGFAVNPVPEPTTLAIAGLGGLSLLAFRRKKA